MMNWRIGAAVVLAAGATCGFEAYAQVDEAAANLLKESAAAIAKVPGVSYQSQLYGVGALKEIMDGSGEVKQIRTPAQPGRRSPVWIKGAVKELGKGKTPFTVSTDGTVVEWIDDPSNTHFKRSINDRTDAQRVLSLGSQILLNEFAEPEPFSKQLKAQKIELKEKEQVRGVDCSVVLVSWEGGLRSEMWWIGVDDHLPRKIEMAHGQNRDLAKGTEIWDLKTLENPSVAEFALKTPPGFHEDFKVVQTPDPIVKQPEIQRPVAPTARPWIGIASGAPAPEFNLQSAEGKTVSLSELKGKALVLTFGGSRFPKTDVVAGVVADILKENEGKEVKAYTLACREESEQTALAYAKGSKLPVLLGADAVRSEYKVVGFPFTCVITPDGRVCKSFQGMVSKAQLAEAVEKALANEVMTPEAPPAAAPTPLVRPGPAPAPTNNPVINPDISPTKK